MKLLWAVDPFESAKQIHNNTVATLKALSRGTEAEIEPAYVLSPSHLAIPFELSPPSIHEYRPAAQRALDQFVQARELAALQSLKKPVILVHRTPSLKGTARALAQYARTSGAHSIVVGSHGKKGLNRALLGSFTESLLQESSTPVLIVGPGSQVSPRIKRILFATDFSARSKAAFKKILSLAKPLKAEVTLLHAIVNPIEPVFQSGVYLLGGGWVPVPHYFEEREKAQRNVADRWIRRAHKAGVKVKRVIDNRAPSVVQSILDYAKTEKADMIAMAAESGVFTSTLLGSITRQMTRRTPCPVWVIPRKA